MLDAGASRLFGTIIRTGVREFKSVQSTTSSQRSRKSQIFQKSPIKEVLIPESNSPDMTDDELTRETDTMGNESKIENEQSKLNQDQTNTDPPWDSFNQDNFQYIGGSAKVLKDRSSLAGYNREPNWSPEPSHDLESCDNESREHPNSGPPSNLSDPSDCHSQQTSN